jgi:hypothetical protein
MNPKVAPNPNDIAAICKSPKYIATADIKYEVNLNTPYIENSFCVFNFSFLVIIT